MPQQSTKISCDEAGLAVRRADSKELPQTASLSWNDIHTVVAYKRDVFAYDLICLALGTEKQSIEVNEEMQGWSELVERLPQFLPGTPPLSEWWDQVAFPPFAPSARTLFKRA